MAHQHEHVERPASGQPGVIASGVAGRIRWNGQAVRCPECGADDRWVLSVEQPAGVAGDVAVAECASGHRVEHPLLYPAIVYAVAEWTSRPAGDRPDKAYQQGDTGITCNWVPHWIEWTQQDGLRVPTYRNWDDPEAAAIDWARWPETVAGQKLVDEVRKWAANTAHSDLSMSWMSRWGTTDPDVRHIELIANAGERGLGR